MCLSKLHHDDCGCHADGYHGDADADVNGDHDDVDDPDHDEEFCCGVFGGHVGVGSSHCCGAGGAAGVNDGCGCVDDGCELKGWRPSLDHRCLVDLWYLNVLSCCCCCLMKYYEPEKNRI